MSNSRQYKVSATPLAHPIRLWAANYVWTTRRWFSLARDNRVRAAIRKGGLCTRRRAQGGRMVSSEAEKRFNVGDPDWQLIHIGNARAERIMRISFDGASR